MLLCFFVSLFQHRPGRCQRIRLPLRVRRAGGRQAFGFPAWYGRNLDALYDLLTEPMEPVTLTIYDWDALVEALGEKASALRRVLNDAGQENPNLTVLLLGGEDEI